MSMWWPNNSSVKLNLSERLSSHYCKLPCLIGFLGNHISLTSVVFVSTVAMHTVDVCDVRLDCRYARPLTSVTSVSTVTMHDHWRLWCSSRLSLCKTIDVCDVRLDCRFARPLTSVTSVSTVALRDHNRYIRNSLPFVKLINTYGQVHKQWKCMLEFIYHQN